MESTDKMGSDAVIDFVNATKTVEVDMQTLSVTPIWMRRQQLSIEYRKEGHGSDFQ
jgi:hypothetical protein